LRTTRCFLELKKRGLPVNGWSKAPAGDLTWIESLIKIAAKHSWFDDTFLQSVHSQCSDRGSISAKQREALLKIEKVLKDR